MNITTYLILVTFCGGICSDMTTDKLRMIESSPYQGVAIGITDGYDTKRYTYEDYTNFCKLISTAKKAGIWNKHIWSWIYLNRLIAISDSSSSPYWEGRDISHYYANIKGMDILNRAGALTCFYQDWSNALNLAKFTNSPGVILDDEFYNNSKLTVKKIADDQRLSEDETRKTLKNIGRNLITVANQIKPDVVILILVGKMFNIPNIDIHKFEDPRVYIFASMLESAKGSKIKIIAGGETDFGYCFIDRHDLLETIVQRQRRYGAIMSKYSKNIVLGGTIAPWNNLGWRNKACAWTRDKCGKASMQSLNDFVPLFKELFKTYPYVWIYAAAELGYNPYDLGAAPAFNAAIQQGFESE